MTFTLITLSYQSGETIRRCLDALLAQGADEVIHADNGSTDIDLDRLQSDYPAVRQVRNGANLGFAAGMNRAAAAATTDWIGFVNPDAFAAPDWLAAMKAAIAAHPDVHILTSLQLDDVRPDVLDGAGDAVTAFGFPYRMGWSRPVPAALKTAHVFAPCGAAFIIRRSLFEALDGFDEHFFCYCEDADLGFRAQLRGEPCLFVAEARVRHIGSASTAKRSDFALWHGYRNRIWLYFKSMPLALLIPTLPVHVGLTLVAVVADTLKGRGRIAWSGIGAAIKDIGPIVHVRKKVQKARRLSVLRLASRLTWNPLTILKRGLDHRSLP
jgi:GT2 family glycosyltransferase